MPKIGQDILKRIDLPTDGAYVVVLTNPKGDVWEKLQSQDSNIDAGSVMFASLIKEWNFTDDNDNDAPITPENVKKALSNFDILKIQDALGMTSIILSDAKKNNSPSTSPTKEAPIPPLNTQS